MNILIISPAWIGDAIMAESLYQTLKIKHPKAALTVIAPSAVADLHQRMSSVDHVMTHDFSRGKLDLKKRYDLGKALRKEKFDITYVLPNSWKSALVPWFAKIPKRIGWLGEMRYGLLNQTQKLDKSLYPLMISRYLALADVDFKSGQYPTPKLMAKPTKTKLVDTSQKQKIIALCPGAAYGSSKRWPVKYFAEVAKHLVQQNTAVWLFGGSSDQSICDEINALTQQNCTNLAGKTSLTEMIDLMALTDQVITNDTGLMHVAAALDKPLIAIFGSSSPGFTPPLSDKAFILSEDNLTCKPCFARECPLGDLQCMTIITPQKVIDQLTQI